MTRFLTQALVVARRDFTAIVLTPTFLIFLLAPLFMLTVATIGGLGATHVMEGSRGTALVIAGQDELPRLHAAEQRLRGIMGDPGPPAVDFRTLRGMSKSEAQALVRQGEASAVLFAGADRPQVFHAAHASREGQYLGLLAASASGVPPDVETVSETESSQNGRPRTGAAFGAVFAMFFLSLLLASQTISMLAEERNNKVIEILAAALPLEAMFLGKLVGMLGVALVFTLFWGSVAGLAASAGLGGLSFDAIAPGAGVAGFVALFFGYFIMCFLLLGAVFLGVGAQASTMREIQMLSLPVTIFQVGMFALASASAGQPDSAAGLIAAVFPFSSPFAMAGRAALGVPAWQHLAAFAWQGLWLAVTITVAARLFRRGVLKSTGARR